jgi:molybdopterin/thiamine biosynthesis adenylyltransferase
MFSDDEVERYARHLVLREIGGPGQQRLKAARVALVGVGGVGAPAALYLAAAGVGTLRLIDDDAVSLSNLQRQILFDTAQVGQPKVTAGATRLTGLNPHVRLELHAERLTAASAAGLLADVDLVLDGSDSFETREIVGDVCVALGVPLIAGALGRWAGQVVLLRGQPCWRCYVPEPPADAETCARMGVVGALAGVVGSAAALLAVRTLTDAGEDAAGQLLLFDGLDWRARTVRIGADPHCPVCSGRG